METINELKSKIHKIFRPGTTVLERKYLVGREQEIKDLEKVLSRHGEHAIIIGDRGVGKTSLVRIVLKELGQKYYDRTLNTHKTTFESLFKSLLNDAGIDLDITEDEKVSKSTSEIKGGIKVIGGKIASEKTFSEKHSYNNSALNPWDVYKYLKNKDKIIFVLDEYDAIHDMANEDEIRSSTAYTLKTISDHASDCESKIIIVGVARSSHELIGKHLSIERCLKELFLRQLKKQHVLDFLEIAEEEIGISFDNRVKTEIVENSLGYPYFVHLVSLESIESMFERDINDRNITWQDYERGFEKASKQAFQAELSKYKSTVETALPSEKAFIYLLASSSRYPINRKTLKNLIPKNEKELFDNYDLIMNTLIIEKRLLHLSTTTDELRFVDPLLRPFLKSYARLNTKTDNTPTLFDDSFE